MSDNVVTRKSIYWFQISHFILDNYPGFILPILPFIAKHISLSMTTALLLVTIANIASHILQPVFGFLADNCKRRFFIFWGLIIASVFIPAMGLCKNFIELAIIIIIGTTGVGFFHPQSTTFITHIADKIGNTKKDVSWFMSYGTVGYATGAIIATRIYDYLGLPYLMLTSLFGIIAALSMFYFVPKLPMEFLQSNINKQKFYINDLFKGLNTIISNKIVLLLIITSFLKSLIVSVFTMLMPFYWEQAGFKASAVGNFGFMFLIASTLGMICSPYIEKKIGTRNLFYFSFITILPFALLMFYFSHNILIMGCSYVIAGFLSFLTVPVFIVNAQKLVPEQKNLVSGIVGGFSWGIIAVIIPFVSMIAEHIGILQTIIYSSILPVIFCLFLGKMPKRFE